jgi:ABC-2 type transport system ATP-binding protein
MPGPDAWWSAWAPYWERLEDRHLGVAATESFLHAVAGPVLVAGAGHGLIVDHLRRKGFDVDGVDLDPTMIEMARRRRGIEIVHADARDLPYPARRYQTVILSSGVVDYSEDAAAIRRIVDESLRVLAPHGNLLVAFYQVPPVIERIHRTLGVIDGRNYFMRRIFEIGETVKVAPFRCVRLITGWTGRAYLPTLLRWCRIGFFLPREMKEEHAVIQEILARADADGTGRRALLDSVPTRIPYRDEAGVLELLADLGLVVDEIIRHPDCLVIRHRKFGAEGSGDASRAEASHAEAMRATADGPRGARAHVRTVAVRKRYPGASRDAVTGLNLAIERGTIHGILGPNGAGKTTTLSILCGLIRPDGGRIEFGDGLTAGALRRRLGYVPQDLALYPRLTARENLAFFGRLYGVTGKRLRTRIDALLATVGLADRARDRVETYSTGMMRRLNLAAGLIHEPEIVLLDEPTVGIDPQSRHRILESIAGLKRGGVTILYTTHYLEEAGRLCDRVAILDQGRVLLEGAPGDVVRRFGVRRIEFAAESVPAGLAEEMRARGTFLDAFADGDLLTVLTPGSTPAREAIDAIHAAGEARGARLALTRVVEPSLETVFLDLTGRDVRDPAEAG